MATTPTRERKILRSIGFTDSQLNAYEILNEKEGGSLSEHVRMAFDKYLQKKGYLKQENI